MMNGDKIDFLADADGLAKWARAAGIDCSHKPSKAELKSAWETREALRKLFDKIRAGEAISARRLEPVDRLLGSVEIRERLILRDGRVALAEERLCFTLGANRPIVAVWLEMSHLSE